jgi:MoaA/NifB/PqqE/SkfB family radical SAM enzyme
MNKFSDWKAAWHIDRIADLRAGKDAIPTHLQIIISDLCNQNCHFCAYRRDGGFSTQNFAEDGNRNPARFIPYEKCIEILNDAAAMGVGSVEFTGGGEPTVHKRWADIIGYAQSLGMETGLVTNGVRLKDCEAVQNLTWLRISLDAGNQETYQAMRESRAWPQVMQSLEYAGKLEKPYVGAGFVITRENYLEIEDAALLAKNAGIPYVRLSAMFSTAGDSYYDGIIDTINQQLGKAKKHEDALFKIVDFFDNRIDDLKQQAPDYSFCGYQQFVLYIGGDQKVYTCCTNAYTTHGEIGNLKNQRFSEWIESHRRYDFDAKGCHHCQFNGKNRVINYLLGKPEHVNFV